MALLEKYLHDIAKSYNCAFPDGAKTYADLVARMSGDPPKCYPWDPGQQYFAEEIGRKLANLVTTWDGFHQEFLNGAPSPIPELRIRPKL